MRMPRKAAQPTKPAGPVRERRPSAQPAPERSDQVQSLVRALAIVNRLAAADEGITLTEVAQQVGLSSSTAHRLLTTLEQERYVHFDAERRLWSVGVQAFVAGNAFLKTRSLVGTARPHMRSLMEESEETVNLAVEDRDGAPKAVDPEREALKLAALLHLVPESEAAGLHARPHVGRGGQLIGHLGDRHADVDLVEAVAVQQILGDRFDLVVAEPAAQQGQQREVVSRWNALGVASAKPVHDRTEESVHAAVNFPCEAWSTLGQ